MNPVRLIFTIGLAVSLSQASAQSVNNNAAIAVGLPDLAAINQPVAQARATVQTDTPPRVPSFQELSGNGTEITEFRDYGKPVEIDVRSRFGTHYQMSAPPDAAPRPQDGGQLRGRVPSVNIAY